ncbi:hypothetical protein [Joostella sp. CR20]|uniref:hypothetical protein n=1 Tax=Joostella sp. CR20 TaxID=2804312 RepID=UPI00313E76E6
MKKTLSLLLLVIITGTTFAQDGPREKRGDENRKERREDFRKEFADLSPAQIATLQTKKMALELDLTEAQQKDVLSLNTELATSRKAQMETMKAKKESGEKPTSDERYAMMNKRLDEQLAVQTKMKKILNEDQYKMWKRNQHKKGGKKPMGRKEGMHARK